MRFLTLFSISIFLISALVGCGSSGGSGDGAAGANASLNRATPENALVSTLDTWKSEGRSLNLVTQQVTTTPVTATNYGEVFFTDLSGNIWKFSIISIEYLSTERAIIKTHYTFQKLDEGRLAADFTMVKDVDGWKIDDITLTTLPWFLITKTGIQGFVKDEVTQKPIQGALVYLSGTNYSASTDSTGVYSFMDIPPGTYTIVVKRDGFVIKTIPGVVVQ